MTCRKVKVNEQRKFAIYITTYCMIMVSFRDLSYWHCKTKDIMNTIGTK